MLNQTFSDRNLKRQIKSEDFNSIWSIPSDKNQRSIFFTELSAEINKPDFSLKEFKEIKKSVYSLYMPNDVVDEFALRKLNNNIQHLYKVKQADRHSIINLIISLINEYVPMNILKFDISGFYESINREELLKKLNQDSLLSFKSKLILNNVFSNAKLSTTTGLPRGINISATLSEIVMRNFDTEVKRIDGVYGYVRYVDDILIFTFKSPQVIKDKISSLLPKGLKFNSDKFNFIERQFIANNNKKLYNNYGKPNKDTLEYLGYKFCFGEFSTEANKINIQIADKKVKKIKKRIIFSIKAYVKDGNYNLFKNRMKFLTGNFRITNTKYNSTINSGIYYNYQYINNYNSLDELNVFYRNALFSKSSSFGRKLSARLDANKRRELVKYNFKTGFEKRIIRNFTPIDIAKIKNCWKHE